MRTDHRDVAEFQVTARQLFLPVSGRKEVFPMPHRVVLIPMNTRPVYCVTCLSTPWAFAGTHCIYLWRDCRVSWTRPVAVHAGASLLGRWLLPRVWQHSALSVVGWRSDLRSAANTQQLRRQNFCSRWTSLGELSWSSCAIQTSPMDCSDDSWRDTSFVGKHEHGALWLLICGALEKHLLIRWMVRCHGGLPAIIQYLTGTMYSMISTCWPKATSPVKTTK